MNTQVLGLKINIRWKRHCQRKNINEKVYILSNTINNVLSTFIPHGTITCDDKNHKYHKFN